MGGGDLRRTVSNAIKNIMKYSLHTYSTLYVRIGHLLELKLKKSQLNTRGFNSVTLQKQKSEPLLFIQN